MRITKFVAVGLVAVASAMGGCKNNLNTENANLKAENQSLKSQLDDRNAALDSANTELRSYQQQLAEMKRGGATTSTAGGTAFDGIPGVTGTYSAGEVTASLDSDVLFDSGKTTLKTTAKKSLDSVASVLNSTYAGTTLRIAGHTDTDPIKKSGFESNYHLGFQRAWEVRKYLISKGVPSNRISLASYGPDAPKGSKAKSRRVEIVVITGGSTATASAAGH